MLPAGDRILVLRLAAVVYMCHRESTDMHDVHRHNMHGMSRGVQPSLQDTRVLGHTKWATS